MSLRTIALVAITETFVPVRRPVWQKNCFNEIRLVQAAVGVGTGIAEKNSKGGPDKFPCQS